MPRITTFAAAALCTLAFAASSAAQTILQGPVFNSATGSRYYLVSAADANVARTFARGMGGDLVTINNIAENEFIRTNFLAGFNRKIFIGLNDARLEGTLEWSDGSTGLYRNWAQGEPNNSADRDFVQIVDNGTWGLTEANFTPLSIIELTGPVRVPAEAPTLAAAVGLLTAAGTREIAVAPGDYAARVDLNGGSFVIRGSGRGATRFITSGMGFAVGISQQTALTIESATVTGSGFLCALSVSSSLTVIDCEIDYANIDPAFTLIFANSMGNFSCVFENSVIRSGGTVALGPSNTIPNFNVTLRNALVVARRLTGGNGVSANAVGSTLVGTSATTSFFGAISASQSLSNSIFALPAGAPSPQLTAAYSVLPYFVPGPSNITAQNPGFVNPAIGDYRLRADSPAVNAGNLAALHAARPRSFLDATMNPRVVAGALDIGGLERQPLGSFCPADFNNDNALDINDFFAYLAAYAAGCP